MQAAVVDASVAVKWVVPEAADDRAARLTGAALSAPDILLAECGNALWAKVRRGEIGEDEAFAAIEALASAPLLLTAMPQLVGDALRLALELAHPIYDCLYLALAVQTNTPLVTDDRRFADAVRRNASLAPRLILLRELD